MGKASGIDTYEDALKRVDEFNARYADDFEYFAEPVNINGVEQEELLRLVSEGKLPLSQLPYICNSRMGYSTALLTNEC